MTLILSISSPHYGLQVGDRLVSKGGRPHDPLANKSLVVRCDDGLLAMSYTGLAFIDGLPTDEWLATRITQTSEVTKGALLHGSFEIGDTGTMLRRVAVSLNQSIFAKHPGGLTAVGCQWKEKNGRYVLRSVLWQTIHQNGLLCWRQTIPREMLKREDTVRLNAIGTCPLPSGRMQAISDLAHSSGNAWERVEEELVQAIRDSSELCPDTIGPHCCSTLLRKWHKPNAQIRFLPAEPHTVQNEFESVQVAYTPWIIASDSVNVPSLSVGGLTTEGGLLSYSIQDVGTAPGQTLIGMLARQGRPRS